MWICVIRTSDSQSMLQKKVILSPIFSSILWSDILFYYNFIYDFRFSPPSSAAAAASFIFFVSASKNPWRLGSFTCFPNYQSFSWTFKMFAWAIQCNEQSEYALQRAVLTRTPNDKRYKTKNILNNTFFSVIVLKEKKEEKSMDKNPFRPQADFWIFSTPLFYARPIFSWNVPTNTAIIHRETE